MVFQEVLRNPDITIEAKGLYAYLAGFSGAGDECYPSIGLMCDEMGMSKTRLYKHMAVLVQFGVVEKVQTYNGNIKGRVIYRLTHTVNFSDSRFPKIGENEKQCYPVSENLGFRELGIPKNEETKNNILKNNIINNNRDIDYQLIADMYNDTCVSFPHISKLSDARKKAIKARLRQYSIDDFKRLFQMAEASNFLKGQNNRNWSATFDWLIKDANMAKVLDGNYVDKMPDHQEPEKGDRSIYKDHGEYEQLRRELEEEGTIQGTSETW